MRTAFIALAAAATIVALPAAAAPARDFVVRHTDLDLSSTKDQRKLDSRIVTAAREYCAVGEVQVGSRMRSNRQVECELTVRKLAKEQMAGLIAGAVAKGG